MKEAAQPMIHALRFGRAACFPSPIANDAEFMYATAPDAAELVTCLQCRANLGWRLPGGDEPQPLKEKECPTKKP